MHSKIGTRVRGQHFAHCSTDRLPTPGLRYSRQLHCDLTCVHRGFFFIDTSLKPPRTLKLAMLLRFEFQRTPCNSSKIRRVTSDTYEYDDSQQCSRRVVCDRVNNSRTTLLYSFSPLSNVYFSLFYPTITPKFRYYYSHLPTPRPTRRMRSAQGQVKRRHIL